MEENKDAEFAKDVLLGVSKGAKNPITDALNNGGLEAHYATLPDGTEIISCFTLRVTMQGREPKRKQTLSKKELRNLKNKAKKNDR